MKGIITYIKNGNDCISEFNFALSDNESDVYTTMHEQDVYKQIGEWIKENIKETESPLNIGYKISNMPKFESRLTNLKIRYGKEWDSILMRSLNKTYTLYNP